jgi:hypothetical protein
MQQAALSLEDVVARLAQLPTGDLPALARHLQARLAPELEYLRPGVVELLELARRVREQRAQGPEDGLLAVTPKNLRVEFPEISPTLARVDAGIPISATYVDILAVAW